MVQQIRIERYRDWNLPGSLADPRLFHSDPSDTIFVYPKHLCRGYSQEIPLQDDIGLGIIDREVIRPVVMDMMGFGDCVEFEFQISGPHAGYGFFLPHLRFRNLGFIQVSKRTFKVEIFFKQPALTKYLEAFIENLKSDQKALVERCFQSIYRYYYGSHSGRSHPISASMLSRLFDSNIKPVSPYAPLTFTQLLPDELHSDLVPLWPDVCCPITPAMHRLIEQILSCPYSGATRRAYLRQKALKLVKLRLEAMVQPRLNPDDLSCVCQAEAILRANLVNPPTLEQLARQVGTNRRKLNEGFHRLYGMTPFSYLRHCRLHQAQRLLMTSELSIEGVAAAVGYTSRSRFASAFRQNLGVNPKAFQIQAWQYAS